MKRTTFSLLFYIRRNKLNKSGEAPVFMRITINGERADASVKRSIVPRLWNTTKGKAVENSKLGKDLNLYLDAISANLLQLQRDMELDGVVVSAHAILDRYLCKNLPERHTLYNSRNINRRSSNCPMRISSRHDDKRRGGLKNLL